MEDDVISWDCFRKAACFFAVIRAAVRCWASAAAEAAAALKDPLLQTEIHLFRPILRVRRDHQNTVVVEVEPTAVQLTFRPQVVGETLPFHPRQETPFRLGYVARGAALDGEDGLLPEPD